jgi:hypothetical protein
MSASDVAVADLVGHASLVVSQGALEVLAARATEMDRSGGEGGGKARSGSSDESEQSEDAEE